MSRTRLSTYQAVTEFYSKTLQQHFTTGELIKAPASLGSDWVRIKVAILHTNHKTQKP
jgi:hypothetical protein